MRALEEKDYKKVRDPSRTHGDFLTLGGRPGPASAPGFQAQPWARPELGNVDPGLKKTLFINIGVSLLLVGIIPFGGEHPHINKQGLINPGSTLEFL